MLLLAIAIANGANLLMTRAAARAREIGIRSAIGADRGRLIRQLLAETLLVAGAGSVLGLLVAYGTTRLIVFLAPGDIPALGSIGLNIHVLIFSTVLTVGVTILTGIVPAWRGANIRASDALSSAVAGHGGNLPSRIARSRFVVAELALALMLLAGGGLLLRSFITLLKRLLALRRKAWWRCRSSPTVRRHSERRTSRRSSMPSNCCRKCARRVRYPCCRSWIPLAADRLP